MTSISTINVPFHGDNLYVVNYNGQPYVPMKPIVEGMGMDWASQFTKLKQRFKSTIAEITMVAEDGKSRNMLCIALRKLSGWLHTISPNKVKPEIRDKVIRYQEECDDVLYEYWTTGEVKGKRKVQKALPGKITAEQQEAIKQLVMTRGKALPKEKQAKAMITMWSSLKSHFGCTYKEIDSDKFTEALSLAARVSLEGEYIPKEDKLLGDVKYPSDGRILLTFSHGVVEKSEVIEDGWHVMHLDSFMQIAQKAGYLVAKREDVARQIMSMSNRW